MVSGGPSRTAGHNETKDTTMKVTLTMQFSERAFNEAYANTPNDLACWSRMVHEMIERLHKGGEPTDIVIHNAKGRCEFRSNPGGSIE